MDTGSSLALISADPSGSTNNPYTYDEASGLLTLNYAHMGRRVIEVRW
jgi:hypothetical protein